MNIPTILSTLGLTERESRVYLFLLQNAASTPQEIALHTKMQRPNVYDVMRGLEEKGLIHSKISGRRRLVVAEDPKKLSDIAETQLKEIKQAIPFLQDLESSANFRSQITHFQGKKSMQNLLQDALNTTKKELWFLWPPQDMDKILGQRYIENFIKIRLKKGIRIRSLRPSEKENLYHFESDTTKGKSLTEVAYVPEPFTFSLGMCIYDQKIAFYSSQKESFGFLVESRELAQVMRMFYQMMWQNSGKLKYSE